MRQHSGIDDKKAAREDPRGPLPFMKIRFEAATG